MKQTKEDEKDTLGAEAYVPVSGDAGAEPQAEAAEFVEEKDKKPMDGLEFAKQQLEIAKRLFSGNVPWDMKGTGQYILDEAGNPVEAENVLEWSRWMDDSRHTEINKRFVGRTTLPWGTRISTVFLGLDHGFPFTKNEEQLKKYKPVLWESMCFPAWGWGERDSMRYTSRRNAERGHRLLVARAFRYDMRHPWVIPAGFAFVGYLIGRAFCREVANWISFYAPWLK